MNRRSLLGAVPLAVLVHGGMLAAMESAFAPPPGGNPAAAQQEREGAMEASTAVYELRIYRAYPGKLESLVARFRDDTMRIFAQHGMRSVAYWTAQDEPAKSSMLYYILEHPSQEAAAANWKAFQDDPQWKSAKSKSEEKGPLVEKIESTYLMLTDFSPRLG